MIVLKMKNPELETPEVHAWLLETARRMQEEVDGQLHNFVLFGCTHLPPSGRPMTATEVFQFRHETHWPIIRDEPLSLVDLEPLSPMYLFPPQPVDEEEWAAQCAGAGFSIKDPPDDTALPLEEWTAKVDAFIAEWGFLVWDGDEWQDSTEEQQQHG